MLQAVTLERCKYQPKMTDEGIINGFRSLYLHCDMLSKWGSGGYRVDRRCGVVEVKGVTELLGSTELGGVAELGGVQS